LLPLIASPTGCTKQLISVAEMSVPAAELTRPPGMKPATIASKKRCSQCSRSSGLSNRGQAAGHPATHVVRGLLVRLRILFEQHVQADRLFVQQCRRVVELHRQIPDCKLAL